MLQRHYTWIGKEKFWTGLRQWCQICGSTKPSKNGLKYINLDSLFISLWELGLSPKTLSCERWRKEEAKCALMVLGGYRWSRREGLNLLEIFFSKYSVLGWFEPPLLLYHVPFPHAVPLKSSFGTFTWVSGWLFSFKVRFHPVSFGTDPYLGNERGCFPSDEENYFKCFSSNRLASVEIDVMK